MKFNIDQLRHNVTVQGPKGHLEGDALEKELLNVLRLIADARPHEMKDGALFMLLIASNGGCKIEIRQEENQNTFRYELWPSNPDSIPTLLGLKMRSFRVGKSYVAGLDAITGEETK